MQTEYARREGGEDGRRRGGGGTGGGRDGTTIDAERGTSDGNVDNDKKEGATMMEGRHEEEGRVVADQK